MSLDRNAVLAAGARLADEARRFNSLGWMRATAGNLSLVVDRDPLRLVVTASGRDKGELAAADVAVVDATGAPVAVDGLDPVKPSAEAGLHARAAALSGATAIVHVHPIAAVAAGARWPDGVVLRDLEMLKAIGRAAHDDEVRVPVIQNSQDMGELGDRLAAVFDPAVPAVIVAAHGIYVWGATPEEARWRTEAFDWLLSYRLQVA